jgi:hypothetical protein
MRARGPDIRDERPDLRPIVIACGVVILDATTKIIAGALASRGLARAFVVTALNPAAAVR